MRQHSRRSRRRKVVVGTLALAFVAAAVIWSFESATSTSPAAPSCRDRLPALNASIVRMDKQLRKRNLDARVLRRHVTRLSNALRTIERRYSSRKLPPDAFKRY